MNTHTKLKISGLVIFIILLFGCEFLEAQTPQQAVAHTHRATRRRTAVVVSSATKANDQQQAAAQSEQAAAAPATATAAEPAPAKTTTPPPASTQALLPIGSVVTSLPAGCASEAVGGEEYYHCGENYYKAAYQEGTIVYITVKAPK